MKANGIKALDYRVQGGELVLVLTDTSLEEIMGMDTTLLRITTDDGDLADSFAGYQVARAAYDVADRSFAVTLAREIKDTTAKALDKLSEELAAAKILLGVE